MEEQRESPKKWEDILTYPVVGKLDETFLEEYYGRFFLELLDGNALIRKGIESLKKQDVSRAKKCFALASGKETEGWASNALGDLCYKEKNYGEAFAWYQKSAVQGNPLGLYNLGFAWQYGLGTEKNRGQAIKNYKKAAKKGHLYGAHMLKCMGGEE